MLDTLSRFELGDEVMVKVGMVGSEGKDFVWVGPYRITGLGRTGNRLIARVLQLTEPDPRNFVEVSLDSLRKLESIKKKIVPRKRVL